MTTPEDLGKSQGNERETHWLWQGSRGKASDPLNWSNGKPRPGIKAYIFPEHHVAVEWDISDWTLYVEWDHELVSFEISETVYFYGEVFVPENIKVFVQSTVNGETVAGPPTLTDSLEREIADKANSGTTYDVILKDYGITQETFDDIMHRLDATNTFTGTTSTLWSVATNWSLGHKPLAGEDIVYDINTRNLSIDETTAAILSFTMSGSAGTVSQTAGSRLVTGTFSQSAGTFTLGAAIDGSGNCSLTGGTFTASTSYKYNWSGTGTWTHSSGCTLNANNLGLVCSGSGGTVSTDTSSAVNTLTASESITVTTGGSTAMGVRILSVAGTKTLTIASGKQLSSQVGYASGSFSNSGTIAGSGTLCFCHRDNDSTVSVGGTISCPVVARAISTATANRQMTLGATMTLGSTLTIQTDHATYTFTLDNANYAVDVTGETNIYAVMKYGSSTSYARGGIRVQAAATCDLGSCTLQVWTLWNSNYGSSAVTYGTSTVAFQNSADIHTRNPGITDRSTFYDFSFAASTTITLQTDFIAYKHVLTIGNSVALAVASGTRHFTWVGTATGTPLVMGSSITWGAGTVFDYAPRIPDNNVVCTIAGGVYPILNIANDGGAGTSVRFNLGGAITATSVYNAGYAGIGTNAITHQFYTTNYNVTTSSNLIFTYYSGFVGVNLFYAGSSTIDVNGFFSMSAATRLYGETSTIYSAGNFSINYEFDYGISSVILDGTGYVKNVDYSFYDLTIQASGTYTTNTNEITVIHNFTLNSGTWAPVHSWEVYGAVSCVGGTLTGDVTHYLIADGGFSLTSGCTLTDNVFYLQADSHTPDVLHLDSTNALHTLKVQDNVILESTYSQVFVKTSFTVDAGKTFYIKNGLQLEIMDTAIGSYTNGGTIASYSGHGNIDFLLKGTARSITPGTFSTGLNVYVTLDTTATASTTLTLTGALDIPYEFLIQSGHATYKATVDTGSNYALTVGGQAGITNNLKCNASTVDFNGAVNITGSLDPNTATIKCAAGWTAGAGTITTRTGWTFKLDGTGNVDPGGATNHYDYVLLAPSGTVTLVNTKLQVDGNFDLQGSTFVQNYDVTVEGVTTMSTGTWTGDATHAFETKDNLTFESGCTLTDNTVYLTLNYSPTEYITWTSTNALHTLYVPTNGYIFSPVEYEIWVATSCVIGSGGYLLIESSNYLGLRDAAISAFSNSGIVDGIDTDAAVLLSARGTARAFTPGTITNCSLHVNGHSTMSASTTISLSTNLSLTGGWFYVYSSSASYDVTFDIGSNTLDCNAYCNIGSVSGSNYGILKLSSGVLQVGYICSLKAKGKLDADTGTIEVDGALSFLDFYTNYINFSYDLSTIHVKVNATCQVVDCYHLTVDSGKTVTGKTGDWSEFEIHGVCTLGNSCTLTGPWFWIISGATANPLVVGTSCVITSANVFYMMCNAPTVYVPGITLYGQTQFNSAGQNVNYVMTGNILTGLHFIGVAGSQTATYSLQTFTHTCAGYATLIGSKGVLDFDSGTYITGTADGTQFVIHAGGNIDPGTGAGLLKFIGGGWGPTNLNLNGMTIPNFHLELVASSGETWTSGTYSVQGYMTIKTGKFYTQTSNMDIGGKLTIDNAGGGKYGLWTQGTGSHTIAGGMEIVSGAVFTKGSGTLTFDGTASVLEGNTVKSDLGPIACSGSVVITQGSALYMTSLNVSSGQWTTSGSNYGLDATDVTIAGTLTGNASTILCSGNWNATGGTFTHGTSTVKMDGASAVQVLTASAFYTLIVEQSGVSPDVRPSGTININNVLTCTSGSIDNSVNNPNIFVFAGMTIAGTFNWTKGTGTITFDGTQTVTDSHTSEWPQLDKVATVGAVTVTQGSYLYMSYLNIQASGVWTTSNFNLICSASSPGVTITGTFNAGSSTITCIGDWNNDGLFNYGTSTVIVMSPTGETAYIENEGLSGADAFYNLYLQPVGDWFEVVLVTDKVPEIKHNFVLYSTGQCTTADMFSITTQPPNIDGTWTRNGGAVNTILCFSLEVQEDSILVSGDTPWAVVKFDDVAYGAEWNADILFGGL